tara:strand:- start:687 stop:1439 length:753 start_codon:yes stop_codon:yes gene_type:complete
MIEFIQNELKPIIEDTVNPRIGVITLSTDFTIEQDFRKVCHDIPVDIFFNRIPFNNPLNHENYLKMIDHIPEISKQILPNQKLDVVAYGCTSGTIAIGVERIKEQIRKSKPQSLITTPITAALKAFKELNLKKIAVLTPYPKEVNISVFNFLKQNKLEIDSFSSFNLNYDSEIAQVSLDSLMDQISKINLLNVDGLFVSCTALKILDILEKVEKEFGITVISSNQAIIWDCLKLSKIKSEVFGYGNLFKF